MSKMNFKEALEFMLTDRRGPNKLYVGCKSFVAEINNWVVNVDEDEGWPYVCADVCSVHGAMPFIGEGTSCLTQKRKNHYGEVVKWYLGTEDVFFTTVEEAFEHAAECIYNYVKDLENGLSKKTDDAAECIMNMLGISN